MRVLCIDAKKRPGDYPGTPNVAEGSVYHTTSTCNGFGADRTVELCYKLEEFDQKYCWECDHFIPLSDISETEMHRNYQVKKQVETVN